MSCYVDGMRVAILVVLLAVTVGACSSNEPLRVVQIQLGRSLNSDNTIAAPTYSFGAHDAIILSVMTAGKGSGTVSVRWTYGSRVLDEPKKQIRYTYKDSAATDFRLESASGFPAGEYAVEVFLDGQSAGSKKFRVQ